jgi:thiol-disulfide isomerase/thioredoxin
MKALLSSIVLALAFSPTRARVAVAVADETPKENRLLQVGAQAPDWTLVDSGGERRALSSYKGKVVVLDFWATWCAPCQKLMPKMQRLHEKLSARGVAVFGVNSWERGDAAGLMRKKRFTYTSLQGGETIAPAYGVVNLPVVYVVGVDGRVVYGHEGLGGEDLSELIERHLAEHGM